MNHTPSPFLTESSIEILDHLFSAVPPDELRETLIQLYHTFLMRAPDNLHGMETIAKNMYHLIACLADVRRE